LVAHLQELGQLDDLTLKPVLHPDHNSIDPASFNVC